MLQMLPENLLRLGSQAPPAPAAESYVACITLENMDTPQISPDAIQLEQARPAVKKFTNPPGQCSDTSRQLQKGRKREVDPACCQAV